MFDIGFFELLLIAIVGLLVIGPERLPGTIRTLALWWGRLKRGIQNTRAEFEQQIGADDIRRQLHNEEIMRQLNHTRDDIERTVRENTEEIQQHLDTANTSSSENAKTGSPEADSSEADTPKKKESQN